MNTGQNLLNLTGHTNCVIALKAISNSLFASGSMDKTILLWNLTLGTIKSNLSGHTGWILGLEYFNTGYLVILFF